MMFSNIPGIVGFIVLAALPNHPQYKWPKWVAHFITTTFITSTFFAWSLVPSNVAGRTKRTLCTTITFVGYCVGNMTGTQIFRAKDAVSLLNKDYYRLLLTARSLDTSRDSLFALCVW